MRPEAELSVAAAQQDLTCRTIWSWPQAGRHADHTRALTRGPDQPQEAPCSCGGGRAAGAAIHTEPFAWGASHQVPAGPADSNTGIQRLKHKGVGCGWRQLMSPSTAAVVDFAVQLAIRRLRDLHGGRCQAITGELPCAVQQRKLSDRCSS